MQGRPVSLATCHGKERALGLEIHEQLLARRANFTHCRVGAGTDLAPWLEQVGFPSHALIVRPNQGEGAILVRKGLQTAPELQAALAEARHASADGLALVETDMRAHLNPTRMAAIRALAFRLVRRIARACPAGGVAWPPSWSRQRCSAACVVTIARSCPGAMASRRPILGTVCPAIPEPALGLGASPEPTQSVAQALSPSPAPQPLPQAIKSISRANRSPSQAGWGRS